MENLKINGYYIDTGLPAYNNYGRVGNEWRENTTFYIDLNKKVYLDGMVLKDIYESEINDKKQGRIEGDKDYTPIGERVGDGKNCFNSIVFSSFSMGKGVYYDENHSIVRMNSNGMVLPGNIGISLDDNEKEERLKNKSLLFFEDFKKIKSMLNSINALSIGDVNNVTNKAEIPGIDIEALQIFQHNPKKFLEHYCKESNEDYHTFKKFINKMHQMFNIVQWTFESEYCLYPALILLIASAYQDLNKLQEKANQPLLEYMLCFHSDLNGLNPTLLTIWNDTCKDLFHNDDLFQKPSSLVFMTMSFNCSLYDHSIMMNKLFEEIVLCPFSDIQINDKISSLDFCKSLLNVSTIEQVKRRSIISPWINHQEPMSASELPNSTMIDEKFIKQLSETAQHHDLQGILLWSDRGDYSSFYKHTPPPPSKSTFDDSISNFYSLENSKKLHHYLFSSDQKL